MSFNYRRFILTLVGALIVNVCAQVSHADTILLFSRQFGTSSETSLSTTDLPTYGDRVTSNIQGANLHKYGGAANTPNIVVDYSADERTWTSGFSDLQNVIYTPFSGDEKIIVTLTADPGYLVRVNGFDIAGWNGGDFIADSVKIYDGSNATLYSQTNALIHGDSFGPAHTSYSFSNIVSQKLRIEINGTNTIGTWGAESLGFDNLSFSQVPEPSTIGVTFFCAIAATSYYRRKKRSSSL